MNRVTLLGNKDHGKSTLIGNLLIQTGSVSEQRINDAKKTSRSLGRKFEPGYILDSFQEEREREMTIDTTRAQVKYKNTGFEFIDVPGHEELMKNMLSGASYADFALLLISAKPGEGITEQTKRHLFVAKMMGINRLVVAVNKLDTVEYSQEKFDEIELDIRSYLRKIGFNEGEVQFVPISAYNAENLVRSSPKMRWYGGKSLVEALVGMSKAEKREKEGKLLISLQGFLEGDERSVFGKILSGKLNRGQSVISLPSGKSAKVLDIFVSGSRKPGAGKGNVVTLRLDRGIGSGVKGAILAARKDACNSGDTIHALLLTTKQLNGSLAVKINGVEAKCKKMVVRSAIDVATGECKVSDKIKPLNAGSVDLKLDRKVATDRFDNTPEIGRFVLYTNKSFSGIGIITIDLMKKILVMDTGSFRVFGGAAKTAYDTYLYFKKKGYKADLFGDFSRIDKAVKPVDVTRLKPNYYDAVLLNSIRDVPVVRKSLDPLGSRTIFIYTDRGNVLNNFNKAGLGRVLPKMLARQFLMMKMRGWLDCYVAITAEQYEYARAFFTESTKVRFIPNWYSKEFRRLNSVRKDGSAIYVGRLDERQKKVRFLIEGIGKVVNDHPELETKLLLKIVGNGPDESAYKGEVEELGLRENIRFYSFVKLDELVSLYNRSLFFVSTSGWEGFAGTFVESMACGLPLLINQQNNTILSYKPRRDLVKSGYNGLVYEYGDIDDFAEKFYKIYADKALRERLSARSYSFSKQFAMDPNIEKYRKVVEELSK